MTVKFEQHGKPTYATLIGEVLVTQKTAEECGDKHARGDRRYRVVVVGPPLRIVIERAVGRDALQNVIWEVPKGEPLSPQLAAWLMLQALASSGQPATHFIQAASGEEDTNLDSIRGRIIVDPKGEPR